VTAASTGTGSTRPEYCRRMAAAPISAIRGASRATSWRTVRPVSIAAGYERLDRTVQQLLLQHTLIGRTARNAACAARIMARSSASSMRLASGSDRRAETPVQVRDIAARHRHIQHCVHSPPQRGRCQQARSGGRSRQRVLQSDEASVRRGEPARGEVEGPQMILEIDVQPLAAGVTSRLGRHPYQ
jgi:hypothetical protein